MKDIGHDVGLFIEMDTRKDNGDILWFVIYTYFMAEVSL